MRPARAAAVVVALLGVAGVGLGVAGTPGSLRASANSFVNDRAAGTVATQAHNSPSVAVDPRRPSTIVVANRLDAPELGCTLSVSSNGGRRGNRCR